MSKTKWPETVPVLEAKDTCAHVYTDGERHCLSGWCGLVFGDGVTGFFSNPIASCAYTHLREAADSVLLYKVPSNSVCEINDDITPELRAVIWNRAMCKLGYTEGNPEAKHLPPPSRQTRSE